MADRNHKSLLESTKNTRELKGYSAGSAKYTQKMTLLDVMIAVGGITDFADGNRATLLRTSEGNKQYSVRLKDLVKRGDVSANVEMKPGDVLIIPQNWF